VKSYILTAALGREGMLEPMLINCPHIVKRELYVRWAWEVGRHDPESCAINPDDIPIIPANQLSPPVAELLNWKQADRKS
jgi:hypothetical protein